MATKKAIKKPKIKVASIKSLKQAQAAEKRIKDYESRVSAAKKAKAKKESEKKQLESAKKRIQGKLSGLGKK